MQVDVVAPFGTACADNGIVVSATPKLAIAAIASIARNALDLDSISRAIALSYLSDSVSSSSFEVEGLNQVYKRYENIMSKAVSKASAMRLRAFVRLKRRIKNNIS